jgi:endonuclease/exonuclease/phosphatase family metal-dependent hydrolase
MPVPIRFVACTYNLWNDRRWPGREPVLRKFMEYHAPDIVCLQELRPVTRAVLDDVLSTHRRVEDPFEGWIQEGNIFWNAELFEMMAYGAEDIGILEKLRRLFWVRLKIRGSDPARVLFVSTAHYTWPGHQVELEQEKNLRIPQARKTLQVLGELVPGEEPMLFMGDLNDSGHPIRILHEGGLADSFNGLGRYTTSTWPAAPIDQGTPEVDDWIFFRGPIRPMTSQVVDFYVNDLPPSDHKPVLATFRLL